MGVEAVEHSLESATGLSVVLSTRGARIVSVRVPAPRGETVEVTDPTGPYAGATVGRYANRIGGARFELDGHEHCLPANDGTASLHGGPEGFDRRVWSAAAEVLPGGGRVVMDTVSPDGDQGFPGTLAVHAAFTLVGDCLRIEYEATTDRPTVMSLTTHMYWNLGGAEGRGRPIDQDLLVAAERYLAIDDEKIPTGAVLDVRGTAFDFRHRRTIEHDYDHCYVLDGHDPAAVLCDPRSGRRLDLATDQPALQVYTGHPGGVALEPQQFPDAPNRPGFPPAVLRPGERFCHTTELRFSSGG